MLWRAFVASSAAWMTAIPLAAFAASRPAAPSAVYGFALTVYGIGHFVCHQLPARSFHLWGVSFPVCARCTGIYTGAAAAAIAMSLTGRRFHTNRPRPVLLLAFVPTAATLVFEWTTGVTPANWI